MHRLAFLFFIFIFQTIAFKPLVTASVEPFDLENKKITRSYQNQNIFKLIATIPDELQNLPYATYPNDSIYNTIRFNFNKRFNVFPKAILAPRNFEEAQEALLLLKKYNLKFSIRSGGHCFEPASLSSDYIFDLRNFNTILPDVIHNEVQIGAGCILKDVINTLGAINYVIPTGTCPTVCVTGLTLGGGIGLLTRTFGLTCDSVKSITLLTANAEIIEVNETSYPDLFWALKGAGNGSFGIVLGFTFKMHYVPEVTFFELLWEWNENHSLQIIEAWQKWVETLPASISTSLRLEYKEGNLGIKVIGIKVGNDSFTEWKSAFESLKPQCNFYRDSYVNTTPYWVAEPSLPFNKIKSKILLRPLSSKVIHKITHYLEFLMKKQLNVRVFLNFDGFGGAMPSFKNSFAFRKAFGWWYQAIYWPLQTQNQEALHLIRKIYNQTATDISPYSYANATDYDLKEDYLHAYYGKYVKRLVHIKNRYDPENQFQWKQSIPLKTIKELES